MENLTPEELFDSNYNLALWAARKFAWKEDFEDVTQLAAIGLFKAARNFDQSRGIQFSTYAMYYMRKEIVREYFEKRPMIRPYRAVLENTVKVRRHLHDTEEINDLIALTGLTESEVNEVLEYLARRIDSIEYAISDDGEVKLAEVIPNGEANWDDEIFLNEFIETLDERDATILHLRLNDLAQTEIAAALNTNQMNISRSLKRIKDKYNLFNEEVN